MNWFKSKPCQVCKVKDQVIAELEKQVTRLSGQLAHSREREEKAVDALLERQGTAPVTPQPRMTFKDSENAQKQAFGMFLDEHDDGSGAVLEVDRLNVEKSPLLP